MLCLLLLRRQWLMGMLLCCYAVGARVADVWSHLLWIPQHSGREVGWVHHYRRLHILLTVHPTSITAAAAILLCNTEKQRAEENYPKKLTCYRKVCARLFRGNKLYLSQEHNLFSTQSLFQISTCCCSPSGSFLLLAAAGLDFLLLTVEPRLLIPLMTDIVSSSAPACREFLYEMRGSQQSSRCRAIWNVMNRSRYTWLQKCENYKSDS